MKVGVYTRFWSTAGGGEVYAGALAEVLGEKHQVVLLSEERIDTKRLHDRLGLKLDGLEQQTLGEISDVEFMRATSDFDVFFNCSHGSTRPNGSRHGIYIVHFPDTGENEPRSVIESLVTRALHRGRSVRIGNGFHAEETDGLRKWRWTEGQAEVLVTAPRGANLVLELDLSAEARPEHAGAPMTLSVDGQTFVARDVGRGSTSISVPILGRGPAEPSVVTIRVEPFSPAETSGADDERRLGLQLHSLRLVGLRKVDRVARRIFPRTVMTGPSGDFLGTYRTLVSNSAFTRRWVWRRWGRRSIQIEPPVRKVPAAPKGDVILSVGRFFDPSSGHSKRQLEMVGAFRRMADDVAGWELHLVGGCAERDAAYLGQVRSASRGLPVVLHVNASQVELDAIYGRASIYWHAAGLGEDPVVHPERFEHFGISVVEAMSAGAIPIVLATGGPAEIVRDGRDGYHFRDERDLVRITRSVITNRPERSVLSQSAVARAGHYGRPAFESKVLQLL